MLIGLSRVPSPLPSSTLTVPLALAVATSSGALLPSKCPITTAFGAPGRLKATGAAKLSNWRSSRASKARVHRRARLGEDARERGLSHRCHQLENMVRLLF